MCSNTPPGWPKMSQPPAPLPDRGGPARGDAGRRAAQRPQNANSPSSGPTLSSDPRSPRADLTADSQAEQGSLGLDRLSEAEFSRFSRLNAAYRDKFGFPFIICVRRHTRDSILRNFERRLGNDTDSERKTALDEIGLITRLRLVGKLDGPGKPKVDGRLSTHVLDTLSGAPARGVETFAL